MPEEDSRFSSMSIDQVQIRFAQVHEEVCREKGRVEIRDGAGKGCVLISKEELDTLEEALEILSNTSNVQKMAKTIAALTHAVAQGPLVAPAETSRN